MKNVLCHFWVRILAAVAAALLAGEIFSPAKAQAGCGDYVTVGSEHSNHPQTKPEESPCQRQRESGQKPCHGPRCGSEPIPDPAPPSTPPVRVQDFAFLVQGALAGAGESIPFWAGSDHHSRIHRTFHIYHPPRSV
jgi:hypothetical protein